MNRRKAKSADSLSGPLASTLATDSSWIMLNLALAKIGEVKGVHRMRTSIRRLRSDLKTFRDQMDQETLEEIQAELKWVFSALGPVRELDVQSRWCRRLTKNEADRQRLRPLFRELKRRRATAMANLSETLESERFWRLAARLAHGLALHAPNLDADPNMDRRRLSSICAKLAKASRKVDPNSADEIFHEVRLIAKRARYAAEAISRSTDCQRLAKLASRSASKIRQIQDALGDHQDAVVALRTAREIMDALKICDPEVLEASQHLYTAFERVRDRAASESLTLLKRFRRKNAIRQNKMASSSS